MTAPKLKARYLQPRGYANTSQEPSIPDTRQTFTATLDNNHGVSRQFTGRSANFAPRRVSNQPFVEDDFFDEDDDDEDDDEIEATSAQSPQVRNGASFAGVSVAFPGAAAQQNPFVAGGLMMPPLQQPFLVCHNSSLVYPLRQCNHNNKDINLAGFLCNNSSNLQTACIHNNSAGLLRQTTRLFFLSRKCSNNNRC